MSTPCRHCGTPLTVSFCDLGLSPLANNYLAPEQLDQGEVFYPLHAYVCTSCLLVQLQEFESAENIFSDYLYFSSFSTSWLAHAKAYTQQMTQRFALDGRSQVVEIASNDGYLLQYFVEQGVPVLGVEPAANVAEVAIAKGIPTKVGFFGTEMATAMVADGIRADLLLGNNVLAHVPALNDFVAGMSILLADDGFITMEFPHLLQLMRHNQFDTIYHEHFSYFSFLTVSAVFAKHGLRMFDVDQVPTHGGSLRIFACHAGSTAHATTERVDALLATEREAGLDHLAGYEGYPEQVRRTKRALLQFLIEAKEAGKTVAAYGAPAKGNTLLNYCGVGVDFIDYTVDQSPHKQDRFLPGTHIPIHAPAHIAETKPDYLLVLPWNLKDEIVESMAHIRDWGGQFVFPIPALTVVP
jgi:2-polyprenyl-3-methyl-5-hydroxy-6-metoxy-1,4-benzoquinol methylase